MGIIFLNSLLRTTKSSGVGFGVQGLRFEPLELGLRV